MSRSPARRISERERVVGEAEPVIAEPVLHPGLVVRPQVEEQGAAAGPEHADGLGQRRARVGRVVQRLREQRHVDATRPASGTRSISPRFQMMLRGAVLAGEGAGPLEHGGRAVDRVDPPRPARRPRW